MKNILKSALALSILTIAAGKVNAQLASDAPAPNAAASKAIIERAKTTVTAPAPTSVSVASASSTPASTKAATTTVAKTVVFDPKQTPGSAAETAASSKVATTQANPVKLSASTPESEKVFKPEEVKQEAKPASEETIADKAKKQQ